MAWADTGSNVSEKLAAEAAKKGGLPLWGRVFNAGSLLESAASCSHQKTRGIAASQSIGQIGQSRTSFQRGISQMYGLVNLAIEELVVEVAGADAWEEIKTEVGFDEPSFVILNAYPDKLTYDLVATVSKHLDLTPEQVLHAFGKHWILFTAQRGYGELLDSTADNLIDFLDNLDSMHAHVQHTINGLDLPSFELEPFSDNAYKLRYFSDRPGLAPMVVGLVEGLAEKFDEQWTVEHNQSESAEVDHEVFDLTRVS